MKLATLVFLGTLMGLMININDMIETLKTHIQEKATEKAIKLLEEHPEVLSQEDENGSSGLMIIAYSGLQPVLDRAIQFKESFSFYEAIVVGKTDIVQEYLNNAGADFLNTHSNDGFTPLSLAAFFNRTEIAQLLFDRGADPNLKATNPSQVNALHSAVAQSSYTLCKLFLEGGCDVNAVQTQGVTPLHSAVHRGNLELTRLLVAHGAVLDTEMDNGDTALMIAEREGHTALVNYLKKEAN